MDSIGLSYLHLGRCHQALELFQRVLHTFGKDHIKTESAIFNIGASYVFMGKRNEALEQYERSTKIYGAKNETDA
jgi:tetratricopeptide (TPR) repeat protein